MTGLESINPTIVSRYPQTAANVTSPSKRGTIHSKDRSLSTRGATRSVVCTIRVRGNSPYRVCTLEGEECLRDVCLDERYTTRFSDKSNKLEVKVMSPCQNWMSSTI